MSMATWNWREKEEEGRQKDPSQETKRKRNKDQTSPKRLLNIEDLNRQKLVKKEASPGIQRAYHLSNQYEAHVSSRQAIAEANFTCAASFAIFRQATVAIFFTRAASVPSASQVIAPAISICNATIYT
jgi:hypothetical protein